MAFYLQIRPADCCNCQAEADRAFRKASIWK